MSALVDRSRIWIVSVAIDPPASEDGRAWPCPLCGRFQPLEQMRVIEAEHLEGAETGQRLLVCLDCISEHVPPTADSSHRRYRRSE